MVRRNGSQGPRARARRHDRHHRSLQLDDVTGVEQLRKAHADGIPVVVHAGSVEEITAALARPEVSCVLVADESLLELDLADLTYG